VIKVKEELKNLEIIEYCAEKEMSPSAVKSATVLEKKLYAVRS